MILKVIQKKKEITGVFSLIFEKPENFQSYPGQYLDYELPIEDPYGNTRAFTISASPTEDFLMLSTRHGHTPFKKYLEKMKAGDVIKASHPVGTFILDETSPSVFIAGGIGITPFRSMIKYCFDQNIQTFITLFYCNSDENFVFKDSLEEWRQKLPNLKIIYINTTKQGYLSVKTIKNSVFNIQNSIFYLAGPPKMVDSFEKMLVKNKVDKINIRYDHFDGY